MDSREPECDASGKSKSTTTAAPCCADTGQELTNGTTCEHSRPHGESGNATLSAEGSPAKTFPTQELGLASTESEADYFGNLPASFASWSQESLSWKTSQRSLDGELMPFSGQWPRSGLMLNGQSFRQKCSARRTKGKGSSLLPTPRVSDAERGGRGDLLTILRGYQTRHAGTLPAQDAKNRTGGASLVVKLVSMLPTPTARDWRSGKASDETHGRNSRPLNEVLALMSGNQSGQTNPRFLEWMMGFPLGWTELEPSVTPSCPKSPSGLADES